MRYAITGGIGSGKSYVCQILNERGIEIYDCDNGAKRLMRESEELKKQLTQLIGPNTYIDGTLNKAAVAQFLLASENNKQAINHIVHPAVIYDFYNSGLQWMESAIIFEAHLEHTIDKIICVVAPEDVRIQRIMARDSITKEKAKEWIDCQIPQEEAIRRSDYIIINDGTTPLLPQIDKLLTALTTSL